MFWKSVYFEDKDIGRLKWSSEQWISEELTEDIFVSVVGSKKEVDVESLKQAKQIVLNKESITTEATLFLKSEDISHFAELNNLYLCGLHSSSEIGKFDLEFGVNDWEDAFVLVHFKDGKPHSLSIAD